MYYNLLQNRQKPFTVELYRKINLSCLLFRSQLGKVALTIFNYINTPGFESFIQIVYRLLGWWRGTVVERRSLAGELSLSCARPAADG